MINEGIYTDTELSSEAYHGDKESISRSALMDFKKSPRKYWAKHLNPDRPPAESKPSWEFGTAFHTLILEPHLFDEQYSIAPEPVLLKDVGREVYDNYKHNLSKLEATEKKILSAQTWTTLCEMQDALNRNGRATELIEGAVFESSYFWKDKESGLMLKSRPDILQPNMYVDLKTIDDASPENFQREMAKFGYHIQAAMVVDAIKELTGRTLSACINLCVEKTYPYSIGIYIIDEEAIEAGRKTYKELTLCLRACIVSDEWNDYEPQTINLPRWAL